VCVCVCVCIHYRNYEIIAVHRHMCFLHMLPTNQPTIWPWHFAIKFGTPLPIDGDLIECSFQAHPVELHVTHFVVIQVMTACSVIVWVSCILRNSLLAFSG
jgi:hypothetical protein